MSTREPTPAQRIIGLLGIFTWHYAPWLMAVVMGYAIMRGDLAGAALSGAALASMLGAWLLVRPSGKDSNG